MKISAEGITVRYARAQSDALTDVTTAVDAGSLCAVLGPNGSGKSTLMRALLGLTPLASGAVTLDGRPLKAWDRPSLAQRVAAVAQQESIPFPLTVRELVAMGRYPHLGPLGIERSADREAIGDALGACDLHPFRDRDVGTLSGGEFQRARIARALAQTPGALVLDEPTSSLDIRHQMAILELLRRSADSGLSVLLITHDLEQAARFADRLVLLQDGKVAASGTPAEVLDDRTLTRVYGWPIRVERDAAGTLRIEPERRSPEGPPGSTAPHDPRRS